MIKRHNDKKTLCAIMLAQLKNVVLITEAIKLAFL